MFTCSVWIGFLWLQVLYEAGLFVSAVNPKLIRDFGDNKLRSVKKYVAGVRLRNVDVRLRQ